MQEEGKKATKNTAMLYLMNIAKMIFPLVTLPYLTRVLSTDCFAIVTYAKAVMQYVQIVMMFGFTLSATKDIVNAGGDREAIGRITGAVLEAKGVLALLTAAAVAVLTACIPLLRENPLYVALAFVNIVLTEMLADFLFRGLDRMETITLRFVLAKTVSTLLTFVFIKNDSHVLLIPLFDILGSLVALLLVLREIRRLGITIRRQPLFAAWEKLRLSAVYFASDMATTAFGALNTVLIGIFASKTEVSYWGNCMQLVTAVQSFYTPITNGVYPSMIRTKSLKFLKKLLLIFMPLVTAGCVFCAVLAPTLVTVAFGAQYTPAGPLFRALVPVLFFSFPAMLLGWPALGPIEKQRQTTATTILAAVFQICGLMLLLALGRFELMSLAALRGATEALLFLLRGGLVLRYRREYNP